MYTFVRKKLQVPFLQEASIMTPNVEVEGFGFDDGDGSRGEQMQGTGSGDQTASPSMGGFVTVVYEAMRSGELYAVVGECLRAV